MNGPGGADWRGLAVQALRAAIGDLGDGCRSLLAEAVEHLQEVLTGRPEQTVAALAVPVAVFDCLRGGPPPAGVLAAAGATYLACDVLDDRMDGDTPAIWGTRGTGEVMIGAQLLFLTAGHVVTLGAPDATAEGMRTCFRAMITRLAEGQLRSDAPVSASTGARDVEEAIRGRSGAMLAGFAQLAALAAGAGAERTAAARAFGEELAMARQHLNDVTELVGDRGTDLRNGTATMVLALAFQSIDTQARQALVERLPDAASDTTVRAALIRDLGPAISDVCVLIRLHLAQANRHALFLSGSPVGHDGLTRLIEFTATTVTTFRRTNVHDG